MEEQRPAGDGRVRVRGRWTVGGSTGRWSPRAALDDFVDDDLTLMVGARSAGLLGWSPLELAMVPAGELVHPDDRDVLPNVSDRIRCRRNGFVPFELRLLARDSRYWSTRWHGQRRPDRSVTATGVELLGPDPGIGPPVGVWCWIVDTDVVSWSTDLLDMFGVQIGPPRSYAAFLEVIVDDDREHVARHLDTCLIEGDPALFSFRCPIPCGSRDRWFHAAARRSVDDEGRRRIAGLVKYLNPPPPWPAMSGVSGCG